MLNKILGLVTIPFSIFNLILFLCGVTIGEGFWGVLLIISMLIGGSLGIACGSWPLLIKGGSIFFKAMLEFFVGFFTILFSCLTLSVGKVVAASIPWFKAFISLLHGILIFLAVFAFPAVGVYLKHLL